MKMGMNQPHPVGPALGGVEAGRRGNSRSLTAKHTSQATVPQRDPSVPNPSRVVLDLGLWTVPQKLLISNMLHHLSRLIPPTPT